MANEKERGGPLVDFCRLPEETGVAQVLKDGDQATSLTYHPNLLVVGTLKGKVWCIPHAKGSTAIEIGCQNGRIHDVSTDSAGLHVASGAADGTMAVWPVQPTQGHTRWGSQLAKPVLSIAINPEYSSGSASSRSVCIGGEDGRLILNRRGTFGSSNVTLHTGEGTITAVRWNGSLIAWANAKGVKVFDIESQQKVTQIAVPTLPDGIRPCLVWVEDKLLVGWGCTVAVAHVQLKTGGPAGVRFTNVTSAFRVSGAVVGISPFDAEHLSVLTDHEAGAQFHVCSHDGRVFCSDALPISSSVEGRAEACLASSGNGLPTFISSGGELLTLKRRGMAKHALWLIERALYEKAVELVRVGGGLNATVRQELFLRCAGPLLKNGEFARAAHVLQKLEITEVSTWKECIRLFDEARALQFLTAVITVPPEGAQLPSEVYDGILERLASISPGALITTLNRWPSTVYSAERLVGTLRLALPPGMTEATVGNDGGSEAQTLTVSEEERPLVEALASLHTARGDFPTAVRVLLRIGSRRLFPLLSEHLGDAPALGEEAFQSLGKLFDLDPWETLALLVKFPAVFSPNKVVEALAGRGRNWQHHYLRLLERKDPSAASPFHTLIVDLLIEFQPHELLPFLQRCSGEEPLALEEALGRVKEHGIPEAEAFLLRKSGRDREALEVLLKRLGDVEGALRLVSEAKEQQKELWDQLVAETCGQPQEGMEPQPLAIASLFACLDSRADHGGGTEGSTFPKEATAANLVRRLPSNLEATRVARCVSRVLENSDVDKDVHDTSVQLCRAETSKLSKTLFGRRQRGVPVDLSADVCYVCKGVLKQPPLDTKLEGVRSSADGGLVPAHVLVSEGAAHLSCWKKVCGSKWKAVEDQ